MIIFVSTKSKPKRKPKTEVAQYEAWCKKHGIDPKGKRKSVAKGNDKPFSISGVMRRETPNYPSLDSKVLGAVTSKQKQVYTGDSMLGIASMHKSNYVPVFKADEAVEIAHMRR